MSQTIKKFLLSILIWLLVNLLAIILQVSYGAFPIEALIFPRHAFLFAFIVALAVILCLILNSTVGRFLASYQSAIVSIVGLSVWAIVLGLTTQVQPSAHSHDFAGHLGIRHMTTFSPFVISYCYLLLCLCFATIRRFKLKFSMRNLGFFLNHAGLLLTLYFIGAGAADAKQYTMTVREGNTEWRAVDAKTNKIAELPIAIYLDDFIMEEYAPKLAIVHRNSGQVQPKELPQYMDIDTIRPNGKLMEWNISVKQFFMNAVKANDSTYQHINMPGACPAAYIEAVNTKTGEKHNSWVSSGNNMQLYKFLPIGLSSDSLVIAMTQPEPKAFYSEVDVYLKSNEQINDKRIEVNKPLIADHWVIYQSDYDKALGTMSITSVFDLVFDPWRKYILVSIMMLALGCLFLFWRVDNKKA